MKGIVLFEGQYGSTEQYARWIGEELAFPVMSCRDAAITDLPDYETIIIGSSVTGGSLRAKKWIRRRWNDIRGNRVFLFTVSGTPEWTEEGFKRFITSQFTFDISAGIRAFPLPGRMIFENLPCGIRILLRIASLFMRKPEVRRGMTRSYDNVNRARIEPLVKTVRGR